MKEAKDYHHGGELNRGDVIDLSVNTNPYCEMPSLSDYELFRAVKLYPDRESKSLKKIISEKEGVSSENIIIGNGASQIITLSAFCLELSHALIVEPTFSGYERALDAAKVDFSYCYLEEKDDFQFGDSHIFAIEKFAKKYGDDGKGAVYICNPNNPTGSLIDKKLLRCVLDICDREKVKLVIDESFIDFVCNVKEKSMAEFIKVFPNLFIIRSFTKIYSIPGVRLGYGMCSDQEVMGRIRQMQPEWSVSGLAQVLGEKLICSESFVENSLTYIKKEKDYLTSRIKDIGIKVYPSDTNFILVRLKGMAGLQKSLLENGLYLRNCNNFPGLSDEYFRIAIGRHSDNEKVIDTFRKLF